MFSIETRPISYLIQLILLVSPLLLATGYRTFVDEPFEVSCEFSFSAFISITWYHNGTIDLGTGTLTNNGSTLTINDTTFSDSGDYHCVGTEGSNSSNSTPISITVVVPYAPDVISLSVSSIEYFSAVVSWNGTDMSPPLTETYSILVNRVGSNEEVNLTVPMGSTTFTIPNLIPNNAYEVYVEATNRFSTTQGSTTSFNTSSLRLYFVHRDGNIVPIATGSIFRGGTFVQYPVTEFHCYPNRPEQEITWYQPNGDVIPTSGSGFKSTRDLSTGESVFYTNKAISYDNEGDNFTCSFLDTSNETITSSLGIYFAREENFISLGIRLYGQGNLVYEFVYQRGTFYFNFTQSYTIECIRDSLGAGVWSFDPDLLSNTNITTKDSVLTDVQFDPSGACQYIQCAPTEEYIAVSNQPFFVQTLTSTDRPSFQECIEDNHEFTYQFDDIIDIRITCPLVFGAHFLDVGSITQLQGSVFTDSRRLWFDPSTLATYQLDREFVCEDMYGERVSFRIIVNGIEEIQVLANASSSVGITNNTNFIGNSEIPNYLLCVTQDNSNSATWYVDSNPNRNTAESVPVTNDTTQMPHVVSQRNGRSDLILDGTIRDGAEGFYSCVTNPQVRVGIFLEIPQSPIVEITGNPQNIQVTITTTTLILVCNSTNMPYPNPIYFWTGNMNFNTSLLDTSLLLEADTGVYTCTGSNVVGLSVDTITITVIPPPPQFDLIQLVTTRPIFVSDTFTIQCQFSTLINVTSMFSVEWYINGASVIETSNVSIATSTSVGVGTSVLTVMNSVLSQEGNYSCIARVGDSGATNSGNSAFNFDFPPTPVVSIDPLGLITDYITQDVNITCLVTTLDRFQGALKVDWYQNATIVNTNGNIEIITMTLNATTIESILIITSLVANNAGVYHCVGQIIALLNSEEAMSDVVTVDVTGPPAPTVVIASINPITDYITQNVTIFCYSTALSRFQAGLMVYWYQNGTMVYTKDNIEITTVTLNATTTKSTLSITSLVIDNAGVYHCVGQIIDILNSEEAMSGVITVDVTGPPAPTVMINPLDPISEYITENVSIACVLTTQSQFQDNLGINWYQNGTNINTGGNIEISKIDLSTTTTKSTLSITSLVVDNAGMYQCVGQIIDILNSEEAMSGVISLQVIGPPTPIVSIDSLTPITDYITQNVSITCLVTTLDIFQGALNIEWHKNATIVDTSGNIEITAMNLNATTTKSILKITSLVVNNAGMYQCVGQIIDIVNSEEAMSGVISLQVIGPPTPIVSIDSLTPITDYITQNVSITCLVTTLDIFQGALNIEWHKNATIVDTSGNIEITAMNLNATTTKSILKITSLVVNNAGMYQCVGQIIDILNSEEAMSDVISLQVIGPPTPIVSIDSVTPITDYITQNVSITCLATTLDIFQGALNVEWYQNATIVNTSGNIGIATMNLNSTTRESILTITSLEVDNAGMYHCVGQIMALLNSEEAMSNVITVDVTGPPAPTVAINPVDPITEYITQNVVITCLFTTLARFQASLSISWNQNGTNTGGNIEISTMHLNSTTTESMLTITSLVANNTGTYYCVGQIIALLNSEKATSNAITVDVTGPPTPIVAVNPVAPISDYITQNITLICEYTTLARFQNDLNIEWYQNGIKVTTGNIIQSLNYLDGTTTRSEINIVNLTSANAGEYHCVAQIVRILNSGLGNSTAINIQTTIPPTPTPGFNRIYREYNFELYEDFTFHLHCNFTTVDVLLSNLNIDWFRDSSQIQTSMNVQISTVYQGLDTKDSILTIQKASQSDTGKYYCVGRIGTFDSAIYPDYSITINPTVDIPDIDVTVSSMDTNSVTLSFNPSQVGVAMNGSETYAIYYRVAGSDDHYQVYDAKTSLSITISDLMPGTEYEYIVQTTNEFGSTNSSSSVVSTAVDVTVAPTSTTVNVTVTPTSTAVDGTVPPTSLEAIIGAVIGILIIAIVVVVLLLLLVCWMKTRNKKPRQQRVINQRYARNTQRTSSERVLLTKSTGVGATLSERNYSYTTDETQEKSSTFRRTEGVQETVLMNIETGAAEPLYEDFSYERYNVPIGEFSHKVLEYHLANNAEFDRQFSGLRKDFIHDVTTGSNIVNKPKNRFANIIPYEHSRVKLNVTGDNFSDYINACSIDGYYKPQSYIAAQGPMPNTVHDFWRLIWEKNIEHIVALTRVMEALKKKCEQYWPELENNSCNYGPIEVTLKRVDRFTSYDIRMLELKHKDYLDDTRTVIQFHFIIWPDHGVPIFSSSLLSFINHTKEYHIPGKQEAPLLVHCSAGVGRTGTFIVLDYFIEHLKENDKINVYKMVAQLREARCLMVQTKDQFMFIHDAIQDLITCKDTFVSDHEFQPYLENALIRNLKTMTTPFEDKYELIMRTSRIIDPRDTNESSDLANVMKNRYPEFVPFDSHRVTIIPDHDGDKDYINASFVHSYQRHKGFIAAQSPLDYTVYDFWKMITKYRVQLVVMLSELFEDGHEMSAKYWPEEGKEMLVHYLVIRCEKEEVFEDFVRRKIVVSTEQVRILFINCNITLTSTRCEHFVQVCTVDCMNIILD